MTDVCVIVKFIFMPFSSEILKEKGKYHLTAVQGAAATLKFRFPVRVINNLKRRIYPFRSIFYNRG